MMMGNKIILTELVKQELQNMGVTTLHPAGASIPVDVVFEPPCSIKRMNIQHSLSLGAFSYAVSGFYFACHIARYSSIGEDVQIGRHSHPMHWISSSPLFYANYTDCLGSNFKEGSDFSFERDFKKSTSPVDLKKTLIGNDVWIGHGAFILPGVAIGDGAVIAARSVVTKDVPPYAMMAGVPAKIIRFRFTENLIHGLIDSRWWEFAPWQLKGACLDRVEDFLDFIESLRLSKTEIYKPDPISPRDFLSRNLL